MGGHQGFAQLNALLYKEYLALQRLWYAYAATVCAPVLVLLLTYVVLQSTESSTSNTVLKLNLNSMSPMDLSGSLSAVMLNCGENYGEPKKFRNRHVAVYPASLAAPFLESLTSSGYKRLFKSNDSINDILSKYEPIEEVEVFDFNKDESEDSNIICGSIQFDEESFYGPNPEVTIRTFYASSDAQRSKFFYDKSTSIKFYQSETIFFAALQQVASYFIAQQTYPPLSRSLLEPGAAAENAEQKSFPLDFISAKNLTDSSSHGKFMSTLKTSSTSGPSSYGSATREVNFALPNKTPEDLNDKLYEVSVADVYYLPFIDGVQPTVLEGFNLDLALLILFLVSLFNSMPIVNICQDKSDNIRTLLQSIGVTLSCYYLSKLLAFGILGILTSMLTTVALNFCFFTASDYFLLAITLSLYTVSALALSLLLCTFSRSSTLVSFIFNLLLFAGYFFATWSFPFTPIAERYFKQLLPSYGLTVLLRKLKKIDRKGLGLTWEACFSKGDPLSFFETAGIMLFLIALYFFLALAMEEIKNKYPAWKKILLAAARKGKNYEEKVKPKFEAIREPEGINFFEENGVIIKDLSKTFSSGDSTVYALKSVTFNINPGEVTVLLGKNGAGKSTLFSILQGVVPYDEGEVKIFGLRHPQDTKKIQKKNGVCCQVDCLWSELTVFDHIDIFSRLKGIKPMTKSEKLSLLEKIALEDKENTKIKKLSGGMKRRVSLALAVIGDSSLILLDEPTSGLDPSNRMVIWNSIRRLKKDKSVLISTHYLDEAENLADNIAVLEDGNLCCYGSTFFLKQAFETGYDIIVDKGKGFSSDETYQRFQAICPSCNLVKETSYRIIFNVPVIDASKLPKLIAELENYGGKVERYAFNYSSFDSIFAQATNLVYKSDIEQKQIAENSYKSLENFENGKNPRKSKRSAYFLVYKGLIYRQILIFYRDLPSFFLKAFSGTILILAFWLPYFLAVNRTRPRAFPIDSAAVKVSYHSEDTFLPVGGQLGSITFNSALFKPNEDDYWDTVEVIDSIENESAKAKYGVEIVDFTQKRGTYVFPKAAPVKVQTLLGEVTNFALNVLDAFETKGDPWKPLIGGYFLTNGVKDIRMEKQKYGLVGSSGTIIIFANKFSYNALPVAINKFWTINAKLRNINKEIKVLRYPLYTSDLDKTPPIGVLNTIWFGLVILTSFATGLVLMEKKSFIMHTLFLSGARPLDYWISNLAVDGIINIIAGCATILLGLLVYESWTLFNTEFIGWVFAVGIVFVLSLVNETYFFSRCVLPEALFPYLKYYHLVTGIFLGVPVFINFLYVSRDAESSILVEILSALAFLFPTANACGALLVIGIAAMESSLKDSDYFISTITHRVIACVVLGLAFFCATLAYEQYDYWQYLKKCSIYKKTGTILEMDDFEASDKEILQINRLNKHYSTNCFSRLLKVLKLRWKREESQALGTNEPGNLIAVKHLSAELPIGSIVALVGQNGAGKTTLIKMLVDYLQPTSGNITFKGFDSKVDKKRYRKETGWCPQTNALWPQLTVLDHLKIYYLLQGKDFSDSALEIAKLLNALDIQIHAKKCASALSGGTKRKLNYLIATCSKSNLVILDEPSCGFDPLARALLCQLMAGRVKAIPGSLSILSTHSLAETEGVADFIVIMASGEKIFFGTLLELKDKYRDNFQITIAIPRPSKQEIDLLAGKLSAEGISHFITASVFITIAKKLGMFEDENLLEIFDESDNCPFYNFDRHKNVPLGEVILWAINYEKVLKVKSKLAQYSRLSGKIGSFGQVYTFPVDTKHVFKIFDIFNDKTVEKELGFPMGEFSVETITLEQIVAVINVSCGKRFSFQEGESLNNLASLK